MKRIFIVMLVASLCLGAVAQDSGSILGNIGRARELAVAANSGNAAAQADLGWSLANQQKYDEAFQWFQKSASQGNAKGLYGLGWCYDTGAGVKVDYKVAWDLYVESASKGFPDAQFYLAGAYLQGVDLSGLHIDKNPARGVEWLSTAATGGLAIAQKTLGDCYKIGNGVRQSYIDAIEWYRKAADNGYAPAFTSLGARYLNGEGVAEDFNQALYWFRKAAAAGEDVDLLMGKSYYFLGERGKAISFFEKTRIKGDVESIRWIGSCYASGGLDLEQDLTKAYKYWRDAANKGEYLACVYAGVCCYQGVGTAVNHKDAVSLLLKSFDLVPTPIDEVEADYYRSVVGISSKILSSCYRYGRGVIPDKEAEEYYLGFAEKYNVDETTVSQWVESMTRKFQE